MAHHTAAMRARIAAEYATSQNIKATARKLNTTPRAVRRAVQGLTNCRSTAVHKRRGRPPAVSDVAANKAVDLLLSRQAHGAQHAARLLHGAGLTARVLHRTTVSRAAKRAARRAGQPIRAVQGHPAKELTSATKAARLKFAQSNLKRDWRRAVFTDRKRFTFKCPGVPMYTSRWLRRGERHVAPTVNHAETLNVYAGLTVHGVTKLHVVSGTSRHKSTYANKKGQVAKNITASEYKDVLTTTLLPQGQQCMRAGGSRVWVLQQDNDPAHRGAAKVIDEWSESHGSPFGLPTVQI